MAWAFDAATEIKGTAGSSFISGSHTTSGSDRTLVIGISWLDEATTLNNPSVSSVTYGGVAATARSVARFQYSSNTRSLTSEIWTLDDPATGSNTLNVNLSENPSAPNQPLVIVASYTGTQGVGTNFGSGVATSATLSNTVSTNAAGSALVGFGGITRVQAGYVDHFSAGTGDTEREEVSVNSGNTDYSAVLVDTTATGGSDVISAVAGTTGSRWAFVAVELLEAVGGGGVDGTASPTALGLGHSLPAVAPTGSASAVPSALTNTYSLRSPAPTGGASTTLSALTHSYTLLSPTPSGGGNGTAAPSPLLFTHSLKTVAATGSGRATVTALNHTYTLHGGIATGTVVNNVPAIQNYYARLRR